MSQLEGPARRLPPSLANEIVKLEMAPGAVAHLTGMYHRSIARRLLPEDVLTSNQVSIGWLHPRLVWMARVGGSSPARSFDSVESLMSAGAGALDALPDQEHIYRSSSEAWSHWTVESTEAYGQELDPATSLRLADTSADGSMARISQAAARLQRVSAAIAVENVLLIRSFVHVVGDLNSASFEDAFGAVLVGRDACVSITAAFEMLLHEGGHHSLYLREAFDPFLNNRDALAHHPLRNDERPLRGVMHAAHALARMSLGLSRLCADSDAPPDAFVRRDAAIADLEKTLDVLLEKAERTTLGEAYLASLTQTHEVVVRPI